MAKILIVEDDTTLLQILESFLHRKGYTTENAGNVKTATKLLSQNTYDVLLLDYRLPDGNGLEILANSRQNGNETPAIIMTSFDDVRTAVRAMQSGAFDYVIKPVNPDELLATIKSALTQPQGAAHQPKENGFIAGTSEASDKLYEYIDLVAPTDLAVIIQGESGTGKEHAAKFIHEKSKRAEKPFMAVDCGALSNDLAASELFGHVKGAFTGALQDKKGLFEVADGGTLFLDEIGNLNYEIQVKLLRALQEKTIQPMGSTRQIKTNVRIIAATNDDLINSVNNGSFRQDLYHRLNEFKIQIPPLRQRDNDIVLFIDHFIKLANVELERNVKTISAEARKILLNYDWPGNLRELKNVIKRMVLLTKGEEAEVEALPEEMLFYTNDQPQAQSSGLRSVNEANERALIEKTLKEVKYNKSKAARVLNIDRKTLYNKMERYGLGDTAD
ncbi:sigma-54-dependent Fis family transcriptional regulator [Mucilaginibacter limnophilus]|uniref:Sigma-54-dependent Fis family transcriptional regulator n=1 Tax=Mucilaginibacter limnophilus TaxID=1932778 RepID=A0A3S2Y3Q1_9SPHI|nr:sigma-54 dependent transcriptional regulator [Mucilaginibacter limnophilus]RVU02824.1 sigma-54-dependent Fis family transcriptional regulator [Mucilaginibacter limnophilus]